jgi:hypothetical protein
MTANVLNLLSSFIEHIEHGAGWRLVAGTLTDRSCENSFEPAEVGNLRSHVAKVRDGE